MNHGDIYLFLSLYLIKYLLWFTVTSFSANKSFPNREQLIPSTNNTCHQNCQKCPILPYISWNVPYNVGYGDLLFDMQIMVFTQLKLTGKNNMYLHLTKLMLKLPYFCPHLPQFTCRSWWPTFGIDIKLFYMINNFQSKPICTFNCWNVAPNSSKVSKLPHFHPISA